MNNNENFDKEIFEVSPPHSIEELNDNIMQEDADDVILEIFKDIYRKGDQTQINQALKLLEFKRKEVAIKATQFIVEQSHDQESY